MRVKQPEIFDPKREYKPGERAIYKGMVIIAEIWTKAAQRLADDPGTLFCQRCARCKIDRDVCTGSKCRKGTHGINAERKTNAMEGVEMKPVEFPGVNVVFAKDQPEYVPLPAMKVPNDPQGLIITKWQLSPDELKRIQETGTIHLSVLTFNKPLQPVLLTVDLPTE